MAPPKPSVMSAGRQRDTAPSAAPMKERWSSSLPKSFECAIRGLPFNEPSRFMLNSTVTSDPAAPGDAPSIFTQLPR